MDRIATVRETDIQLNTVSGFSQENSDRDEFLYQKALDFHRRDRFDEAETIFREILARNPFHAGATHFLGLLCHRTDRHEEALERIERSVELEPEKAVFRNNYGVVLQETGRTDDAERSFREAVRLDPGYADARSNLGALLLSQDKLDEAASQLDTALRLVPDHPDALKHKLEVLMRHGRKFAVRDDFHEANRCFHEAASMPGGKELWRWKSLGFCPAVFPDVHSIDRYWNSLDRSLDMALDANVPVDPDTLPADGFTPSFNLPHLDRCCRTIKEKFSKIFEKAFPEPRPTLKNTMRNRKRVRVGFVVTAGHHHGFFRVNRFLIEKVDPRRFEILVFCPETIAEECRKNLRRDDLRIVPFRGSFSRAVRTLREAACDLLYHWKVGGGVYDYFLAMAGAAPIQCTSYGTHGTSGIGAVDYYLSSLILETPDSSADYSESLVLLNSYATSHDPIAPAPPASRGELGLPETGALYFCPHRLAKYHPLFDDYFRTILEKDPSGHILVVTGPRKKPAELYSERLDLSLEKGLRRRVLLRDSLPCEEYQKTLSVADCVLDSPVYAGDLTTHDAFGQGVPVVTQSGRLLVQRYTSGLYGFTGLENLVATNREEYANIAVRLGTDADFRSETSRRILERNGSVFDPTGVVKEYERFFEYAIDTNR